MKVLKHKDYVEPASTKKTIPDVKSLIKEFVGTGKKRYEEIIKHVQKTNYITNDEVVKQIEEIKETEVDYKPVVKEVEIEEPLNEV